MAELTTIDFYGVRIDWPLSAANNRVDWDNSRLGELYRETREQVYVMEYHGGWSKPKLMWRPTSFEWIEEDNIMTYFRAFDENGVFRAEADFGVAWDGNTRQIQGGFKYPLEYGNRYYVPVNNNFATPNTGGYKVTVLDRDNPSETIAFGAKLGGPFTHQAAVITFRLFPVGDDYPNDF